METHKQDMQTNENQYGNTLAMVVKLRPRNTNASKAKPNKSTVNMQTTQASCSVLQEHMQETTPSLKNNAQQLETKEDAQE